MSSRHSRNQAQSLRNTRLGAGEGVEHLHYFALYLELLLLGPGGRARRRGQWWWPRMLARRKHAQFESLAALLLVRVVLIVERRSRVHVEVWAHGEKLHILNRFGEQRKNS